MRKYIVISLNQFMIKLQYKFNLVTSILITMIQIFASIYIWQSIYISSNSYKIGTYTLKEMFTYIIIVNIISLIFKFDIVFKLSTLVRSGKLTTKLLRPISYYEETLSEYIGRIILLIITFLLLIIYFKYNVYYYTNTYTLLLIMTFILNIFMFFNLTLLISTLGFWLIQIWPLRPILNGFYLLLAGIYFPLDILPTYLFKIIKYNPFSMITYIFTRALQGFYSEKELMFHILINFVWLVLFKYTYEYLFNKGLKKYEGMGA